MGFRSGAPQTYPEQTLESRAKPSYVVRISRSWYVFGLDRYGRTIADVILPDGRVLNRELVRAGFAWWYRRYAPEDETLEQLECEARGARRGLWADAEPVPPWEWRVMRKRYR